MPSSTPIYSPRSALEHVVSNPDTVIPVYQPVVDLTDHTVIGYEALARWPASAIVDPVSVFDHARTVGALADVEWACRLAAVQGGLDAGMGAGQALFVNVEPDALDPDRVPPPPRAAQVLGGAAEAGIRLVIELTERALLCDPATVMSTVDAARNFGHAIALDDVGVAAESMALLPMIAPDIVKLDRSLIQHTPSRYSVAVLSALSAYLDHADPLVLAEGIETAAHLDTALSWGARLGQGCFFGPPAALPRLTDSPASIMLGVRPRHITVPPSPSHILDRLDVRIGGAPLLHALSRHLEEHALTLAESASILASFQTAAQFTPTIAARFAALAAVHPFVAVVAGGPGLGPEPAPGVRGALIAADPGAIAAEEAPVAEWAVAVIGQHYCAALIVREAAPTTRSRSFSGAGDERRFEFALTHDRTQATTVARSLMARITARRLDRRGGCNASGT